MSTLFRAITGILIAICILYGPTALNTPAIAGLKSQLAARHAVKHLAASLDVAPLTQIGTISRH
jgi:hypothetical protein